MLSKVKMRGLYVFVICHKNFGGNVFVNRKHASDSIGPTFDIA